MNRSSRACAPTSKTRRAMLLAAAIAPVAAVTGLWMPASAVRGDEGRVTAYKNPNCGCCGAWVSHLEENGFSVAMVDRHDVTPDKRRFGVPDSLYACHTARVAGYTIEGHVPAADIRRLLAEAPDAGGLAVPGMPHGSPGMQTGRVDPYTVIRFDDQGNTREFSRY